MIYNFNVEPFYGIDDFTMENMNEMELLELFPELDEEEIATMAEAV